MSFLDFFSAPGADVNALGTLLTVGGSLKQGSDSQRALDYQAAQLRQQAGQVQASSQMSAFDVDRQTQMIASRALAVAAASGGGASDPTVIGIIAQITSEGAYRKAAALYQGEDQARVMTSQADAKVFEGQQAKQGGNLRAVTNLVGGYARGASLYQRFAGGGPGNGVDLYAGPA